MKKIPELEELIPSYGENNTLKNQYTKICKEQGTHIKELLAENFTDSYTVNEWTAKVTVKESKSMNEDALIEYLKKSLTKEQLKELKIIKRKEYVDESALEEAIYNDKIDADIVVGMDSCMSVTQTPTLTMRKAKGDK